MSGTVSTRAVVAALIRKDLRLELRTRESIPAMLLFSVSTFVLFHFGLDRDELDGDLAAGVLWVDGPLGVGTWQRGGVGR